MNNVFFKKLSLGALIVLILLMIGNDLLFQNISIMMDTKEPFYEVVNKNRNTIIKIGDLNKLEETLNTDILVLGEKNSTINIDGNNYNVSLKGVLGNYKSFFPIQLENGSFVTDIDLDTKKHIIIEPKLSQKIFKNKDTIGVKFSHGDTTFEIVGILKEKLISIFLPNENTIYTSLDVLKDKKLKVPIEAIYIGEKNKENKEISEGNITNALAQYGIDDIKITKVSKKLDKIKMIQTLTMLLLILLITKDFYKILKIRYKKYYFKLNQKIIMTDFKILTKENLYFFLKEMSILLVSIGVLGYLFYRLPTEYLPIKEMMKEDVITLTYYLNNIKKCFSESFTNRNVYLTPLGYMLKGIDITIGISFVISMILLYIYRKYKVIENSFLKELVCLISIICIILCIRIKMPFEFMINKELLSVLITFIFIQNIKAYLGKEMSDEQENNENYCSDTLDV